jgi:hypothetical protein
MRRRHDIDDGTVEALRHGRAPDGRPELAALAALVAELRAVHDAEPVPPLGPELAGLISRGGPEADQSGAGARAGRAGSWSAPGRRAKALIAGAVATFGLVGGLGAAGALPAPVQRVVAFTAGVVGLDFPRPPPASPSSPSRPGVRPDETPPPPSPATTTTACPAPESRRGATTAPDPEAMVSGAQDERACPTPSPAVTVPDSTTTTEPGDSTTTTTAPTSTDQTITTETVTDQIPTDGTTTTTTVPRPSTTRSD